VRTPAALVRADAVAIPLADDSVDLVVTSPPYFALRSYTDDGEHYPGQIGSEPTPAEFLAALWAVTAECRRVLKPSGSMFVNLGDKYAGSAARDVSRSSQFPTPNDAGRPPASKDRRVRTVAEGADIARSADFGGIPTKSLMGLPWRYAIGCIDQLDLILRAEIIWSKPNGLPESVTDRVRRSHEQWFHLTKEPRYYSALDEIREAHTGGSNYGRSDGKAPPTGRIEKMVATGERGGTLGGTNPDLFNPLGKLPGSVWSVPSEPLKVPAHLGVDHFAAFPQEWPRRLILGWSPPGICLDCGEGRRPDVTKELEHVNHSAHSKSHAGADLSNGHRTTNATNVAREHATITGYSCACPTPDAPTRPAVILDPFAGTGTTVMVARALGRYGIGLDLSADYLKLARWRVFDSRHATKTTGRTNRERQGVMDLGGAA
jgi:DNA modification methylase